MMKFLDKSWLLMIILTTMRSSCPVSSESTSTSTTANASSLTSTNSATTNTSPVGSETKLSSSNQPSTTPTTSSITTSSANISSEQTTRNSSDILPSTSIPTATGSTSIKTIASSVTSTTGVQLSTTSAGSETKLSSSNQPSTTPTTSSITTSSANISSEQTTRNSSDILPSTSIPTATGSTSIKTIASSVTSATEVLVSQADDTSNSTTSSETATETATTKVNKIAYNGPCNSSEDNPCDTTNATCSEDKCKCPDRNYFNETMNACLSKIAYNGPCNSSGDNPCDTTNATCSEDKCKCPDRNYFNETMNACLSKIAYNQPCNSSADNPCNTTNATCSENICKCPDKYFYYENLDTCFQKIAYNQPCNSSADNPCNTTNATCSENICKCPDKYFYYETLDTCFQKIAYNQPCNSSADNPCNTTNATCSENICKCPDKYFYYETLDTCFQKIAYNQPCNSSADNPCNTTNATCSENICKCPDKYFYYENLDTCFQKIAYNQPCNSSADNPCNTTNATCSENICKCPDKYFYYENLDTCFQKIAYNQPCNSSADNPCNTTNATCSENICKCPDKYFYYETLDTCFQKIAYNQPCNSSADNPCNTTNATCSENICKCPDKYFYYETLDTCFQKIAYNQPCNSSADNPCNTTNATCSENICKCPDKYFYYETLDTCFQKIAYNQPCNSSADNPCTTTNATCSENICKCPDKYFYYETLDTCFQMPSTPTNKSVSNVTEEAFAISWKDNNPESYTDYDIILPEGAIVHPNFTGINGTFYRFNSNISSLVISGLAAGKQYNISVYTVKVFNDLWKRSDEALNISTYTVPLAPQNVSLPVDRIKNTSFVINLHDSDPAFTNWTLKVIENMNNETETVYMKTYSSDNTNEDVKVDTNLTSGTSYTAYISTSVPEHMSRNTTTKSFFTISNDPTCVQVTTVHETNITINISTSDDRYSSFLVLVGQNSSLSNQSEYSIKQLHPATVYNVTVYTVNGNNLKSTGFTSRDFITRPETPGNGSVSNVSLHQIGLNFPELQYKFDSYYVQYKEGNETYHFTVNEDALNYGYLYIKENLTAGTKYTFEVYTCFQNLSSDGIGWIISYTKPEQISNLNVSDRTKTSLQLHWDRPMEGSVEKYTVSYSCIGPNDDSNNMSNEHNVSSPTQNITLSELNPGTFCIASITTAVGNQKGYAKTEALTVSTTEDGPEVVEVENITSVGSRYIDIQWKRPSNRNGLINRYEIVVSFNGTEVTTAILNCTVCTIQKNLTDLEKFVKDCASALNCDNSLSEDTLHYNATGLHPFRKYTFSIKAFTQKEGKSKNMTWKTKEDKPEGTPQNINGFPDKFTLNLTWEPPKDDDRNGIITKYTVLYSFTNNTCYNSSDGSEVPQQLEVNHTETSLTNLLPFTDYRIQIKASTSVGYGNYSKNSSFLTKQSVPSKIDISKTNWTVTSESVKLEWETPCRPNGIITNYTIHIKNENLNDTQSNRTKTMSSNETEGTIEGLMPYRNYTISISGNTIAGSTDSDHFHVRTNISKPKTPNNLEVKAISSKALDVTWDKPTLEMYTGPTYYVVVTEDKRNGTLFKIPSKYINITGFKNNNCIVEGLEEYWNYTVTLTAITAAGNSTSVSTDGQTKQDVPLAVESIEVLPQANVTLKRSIVVKWKPPTELNKNGIIIHYFVGYSSAPSGKSEVFALPPTSNDYTIENISPGNYVVMVYAATIIGNGTLSNKSTELLPGAPLKAQETSANPLMRGASLQVSDKEKMIAITLPTDSFLCNVTNGVPIEWGVVVAQDNEATDTPYNGNKANFTKKKELYKTWSNVKDKDSIPPYIATPISWSPCSFSSGTRRRRSANQNITTFIVGEDGDCTDRCNGALQPGRKYRVKSYVCTQTGCTETLYSVPIATEPDPTVPIVAGVVSALAVITMAAVVVFLLKRRQVACFSKDVETKSSHRNGNEIILGDIEPKQPNAFRPGPIKLADFPGAVDKMHRDSDLLFADAYKLLKEKSPNHPLTAAEQQCSRPKNRYTNILPFDHSRVKLRPSDDIEGSDYINANYIPGYSSRREYIATQGPMQATFDDFWRMVWEQNVDTIVMLTKLMEKGRRKCDKYWPDIGEPVFYGDLVVSLQSESNLSDYTIKIFEVKLQEERRVVTHFSYLKWPDMGCPETPELLLDFVKAVRQYTNRDKKPSPGPVVVHCSAGVGRTGTFIAVDYLLQHIRDHDDVDIYNFVLEMRNHRLNMVQTEDQYVYIHECLKAFITTDEEEEDEEEEPVYMNTEKEEEHIYVNTAFTKE